VLDIIVRGGDVIDGTGRPRRHADVALKDGRIVDIGNIDGEANEVIDATGKVVSPGFIDVHTHYDAQVFWDSSLSPSPLHGITTVLSGNCGFSIAPLAEDRSDREYLMRMLARVEGMPIESLRQGVPWSWDSMGDYLDAIEGTLGVNAGFMVGHSAIRRAVMGSDATTRQATADEVVAMERLLDESLDAGGLGFSSSWARTHNDAEGEMVPSRHAPREELLALCGVTGRHEGTSLEFIPMVGAFEPWALELMADMSAVAKRPLNWNILVINAATAEEGRSRLTAGDIARSRGGKVIALTMPITFGVRLSFASGFILDAMPGWEEVMRLPRGEKMRMFADRSSREKLNSLAQQPNNPVLGLAKWSRKIIFDVVAEGNRQYVGRTVGEIAAEEGRDPWDVLCDIAVADELMTSFGTNAPPERDEDWQARKEFWLDPRAVIGASDAGAHLDLLASFNYTTILLDEAVRKRGLIDLEQAVRLLTSVPARLYGLVKRGQLEPGWHGDLVVFDPLSIGSDPVTMRFDMPGGAGRLFAGARGVEHVLVNGVPIVSNGAFTANRPGSIVRSGRDTETPALD
jgi:N-acyl-D-aspartate/D-glutamate deacylase